MEPNRVTGEKKKKKKTSSFKSQRTGTTSPFKRILVKESCSLNGKNIGNEKADALTCSLLVLGED